MADRERDGAAVNTWLEQRVSAFGQEVMALGQVIGRAGGAGLQMRRGLVMAQLWPVALSAFPLVVIAAFFVGMVIALTASMQLADLGSAHLVADVVAVAVTTELAPIFTALLMAGKAGAGLASEMGMVTLSGQAQAMRALSLDIDREMLAPRLWACVIGTWFLSVAAIFCGWLGGMVLAAGKFGLSPLHFTNRLVYALEPTHLALGLVKPLGFGLLIAAFGLRMGLKAKADAGELGQHTMRAVVLASFWILIADHLMQTLLMAVLS